MKTVVFAGTGDPAEVLQVRDAPTPEPRFREVRVRMLAAPINPSDLLTIEGRYAKQPALPATMTKLRTMFLSSIFNQCR